MRRMGWFSWLVVVSVLVVLASAGNAAAQAPRHHIVIPESSVVHPGDVGDTAHTNLRIAMPEGGPMSVDVSAAAHTPGLPPFPGLFFETPASLACVYRLVKHPLPGCNPDQITQTATGGSGAIAIVDAFDDPNAVSDLAFFSAFFNLPPADLTVVFASGTRPGLDPTGGWELEESLDIEYAHAMAPNAKIFLVEAATNRFRDLFPAIQLASNLVATNGGGEVTMSFGSGEFLAETQFDVLFTVPGVVYLASAGDGPGTIWPAVSPNVVAAGGTTISRDSSTGRFILENTWQDTGGGPSLVEARPHFQDPIAEIVGPARGTPDLSFDANPNTGVWVISSNTFGGQNPPPGKHFLFVVGGTSLSSPALAGIINNAGKFAGSSQAENAIIYRHLFEDREDFRDIQFGNCGLNMGNFASPGWDFCSGVGSVHGLGGE